MSSNHTDAGMVLWSFGYLESKLEETEIVHYLRSLGIHGSEIELVRVALRKMRQELNRQVQIRVPGAGLSVG